MATSAGPGSGSLDRRVCIIDLTQDDGDGELQASQLARQPTPRLNREMDSTELSSLSFPTRPPQIPQIPQNISFMSSGSISFGSDDRRSATAGSSIPHPSAFRNHEVSKSAQQIARMFESQRSSSFTDSRSTASSALTTAPSTAPANKDNISSQTSRGTPHPANVIKYPPTLRDMSGASLFTNGFGGSFKRQRDGSWKPPVAMNVAQPAAQREAADPEGSARPLNVALARHIEGRKSMKDLLGAFSGTSINTSPEKSHTVQLTNNVAVSAPAGDLANISPDQIITKPAVEPRTDQNPRSNFHTLLTACSERRSCSPDSVLDSDAQSPVRDVPLDAARVSPSMIVNTTKRFLEYNRSERHSLFSGPSKRQAPGQTMHRPQSSPVAMMQPRAVASHVPSQQVITAAAAPELLAIWTDEVSWILRSPAKRGQPFKREELLKILELREVKNYSYREIAVWFPGRTEGTMASTYLQKMKPFLDMYRSLLRQLVPGSMQEHQQRMPEQSRNLLMTLNGPAQITAAQPQLENATGALTTADPRPTLHKSEPITFKHFNTNRDKGFQHNLPQSSPRPRGRPPKATTTFMRPMTILGDQNFSANRPKRSTARPVDYFAPLDLSVTVAEEVGASREVQHPATSTARQKQVVSRKQGPAPRPYLSSKERRALTLGSENIYWDQDLGAWEGVAMHIPFSFEEAKAVRDLANEEGFDVHSAEHALALTCVILGDGPIPRRSRDDVEAYLADMQLTKDERSLGACTKLVLGRRTPSFDPGRMLRGRELASNPRASHSQLRTVMLDSLGPSVSFTGTSGDVISLAWSPKGDFAAGSASIADGASMQFNEPCNLLTGNSESQQLRELSAHYTKRASRDDLDPEGSTSAIKESKLFMSVPQVAFSVRGDRMFSAGYDRKLKIWDAASEPGAFTLRHDVEHFAPINLLATHSSEDSVIATGCDSSFNAVRVIRCSSQSAPSDAALFSSRQALDNVSARIYPSALRWSSHPQFSSYLIAGYAANANNDGTDTLGDVQLWDVRHERSIKITASSRHVYDIAWSPHQAMYAVAAKAGHGVNRGTKSTIRCYSPSDYLTFNSKLELECPALDVNDVVFSPYDPHLVTAGCTSGAVYIWDLRKPDEVLLKLQHGESALPLEYETLLEREEWDTGVRFLSFAHQRDRVFSGSSDGIVRSWNPYRAYEDACVAKVAELDSGVMSGAFNHDYTKLLLGSASGSIEMLEPCNADRTMRQTRKFGLVPDPTSSHDSAGRNSSKAITDPDSGIALARKMVEDGTMMLRPFGSFPIQQAVQGPNYHSTGLYDATNTAQTLRWQARAFQLAMGNAATRSENDSPCRIEQCLQSSSRARIGQEDVGDSGRSHDRIPGVLREVRPMAANSAVAGMMRCSRCDRPARPRINEPRGVTGGDNSPWIGTTDRPLCERCAFTCFRCGALADVTSDEVRALSCAGCGGVWRAGVLGYENIEPSAAHLVKFDPAVMKRWKRARAWAKKLEGLADEEQMEYLEGLHGLFGGKG